MCPNIVIGDTLISSWYAMLFIGAVVSVALAIYLRPPDFPLRRKDISIAAALTVIAGLFGARLLYIMLHWNAAEFKVSDLISYRGGFAYFGALVLSILVLWAYTAIKKMRILELLDYSMPFLMLSQVFVRIGCLMAGCCYGKPTVVFWGAAFKAVDGLKRHPTQIYEALLLVIIYLVGRNIYTKKKNLPGYTSLFALALYGAGRFFIEYLRVDSQVVIFNLTLAQITCLAIALIGFFAIRGHPRRGHPTR